MEKLSCQYFLLDDQVSIEMFSRADFGYNIDYVDSDQRRYSRNLIDNPEVKPAGSPIRDYFLDFIPSDPDDETDDGCDVFTGYIAGDSLSGGINQTPLDSLVDQILYNIDKHLADKKAFYIEPGGPDNSANRTTIALTNKQSDTEVARVEITVYPNNSHAVDFHVYSHPDTSRETRMQDAQFSAELLGLLFVSLDSSDQTQAGTELPRYQLRVGHPEPLRMGELEHALIEQYATLGQLYEDNQLPKISPAIDFEKLATSFELEAEVDLQNLAMVALRRAQRLNQPVSNESIEAAYNQLATDAQIAAIEKSF